jgi:hypothetical protein
MARTDQKESKPVFDNVFERRKNDKDFLAVKELKNTFQGILLPTFSILGAYDGSSAHRAALRNFTGILIGRYINAASLIEDNNRVRVQINPERIMDLQEEVARIRKQSILGGGKQLSSR